MRIKVILFVFGLLISSSLISQNSVNRIVGSWSLLDSNEIEMTFEKVKELKGKKTGITFIKNGIMVFRKPDQTCGTKPIPYFNYNGSWKEIKDNIIKVEYRTHEGFKRGNFFIKNIEDNKMVIQIIVDKNVNH